MRPKRREPHVAAAQRLVRCAPEDHGISSASVLAFVERLEGQGSQPHSLMVVRHGVVVAEAWWAPNHPDQRQQLYSITKVATALAVGCAVEDGLVTLDEPLLSHFPEARSVAGPRASKITVGDALGMVTGHLEDSLPRIADRSGQLLSASPAMGFFSYEPEVDPGSVFTYDNGGPILVAELIQRRSGVRMIDYLRPRVLAPLGIDVAVWQQWPQDLDLGFSGLFLTTESVARLGLLLLSGGAWHGHQLVPKSWIELITARLVPTPEGPHGFDWHQGYGLQVWRGRSTAFMAYGAYGQFCLVVPELDLVLVLLSSTSDPQASLDAFWEELVPGVVPGVLPPEPDIEQRLTARLSRAARPARETTAAPARTGPWTFARVGEAGFDTIVGLTVARVSAGWSLVVTESDGVDVHVPCGDGQWPDAAGPVVASGGWVTSNTFVAIIVLVETPHSLSLRCDLRSSALAIEWDWYEAPWCWRTLSRLITGARPPSSARAPGHTFGPSQIFTV